MVPTSYAASAARRSVLIFDDDIEILALAKARFEHEGCSVCTANDTSAFVSGLDEKPDLVLLDLSLKDLDGIQAFALIAARHPQTDILLFSGHAEEVMNHARRLGEQSGLNIIGILRKPFTRRDVVNSLRLPAPRLPSGRRPDDCQHNGQLLALALESGWLEFWYQPKVGLSTGDVVGAECLARVRHPELGLLPPAAFLANASELDLIGLTKRAFHDATRLGLELKDRDNFELSINIAGSLLRRAELLDELLTISGRLPSRQRLILELTETDFVEDPVNMQRFATRAVLHGFGVSIDDFGHGYANFDRLRQAPFCELKIDRSITLGCSNDRNLKTLCKAAVDLAHGFKAKAIAEGVDNWRDLHVLRELSFDVAQGYLFSPPIERHQLARVPARYDIQWRRGQDYSSADLVRENAPKSRVMK